MVWFLFIFRILCILSSFLLTDVRILANEASYGSLWGYLSWSWGNFLGWYIPVFQVSETFNHIYVTFSFWSPHSIYAGFFDGLRMPFLLCTLQPFLLFFTHNNFRLGLVKFTDSFFCLDKSAFEILFTVRIFFFKIKKNLLLFPLFHIIFLPSFWPLLSYVKVSYFLLRFFIQSGSHFSQTGRSLQQGGGACNKEWRFYEVGVACNNTAEVAFWFSSWKVFWGWAEIE